MIKDVKKEYKKQRELMHEEYLRNELENNKRFSREEKNLLFNLLSKLKYGVNRIKEVLTSIWEISRRDDVSIKNLIEELIRDQGINEDNIRQKAEEIRRKLFKKRFPELSKTKKSWNMMVSKLDLPKGLFIEPPHNFEGDNIVIKIKASNINDYEKCVKKLEEIKPQINTIIDSLVK